MESLDKIFGSLVDAVRSSNNLPKLGKNYELLISYPAFADLLKTEGDRIFNLLKAVLERSNSKVSISEKDTLDEIVEFLEKANDVLAERVANLIDESEGRRKEEDLVLVAKDLTFRSSFINTTWNKRRKLDPESKAEETAVCRIESEEVTLFASKNVPRPQLHFQDSIDNSNEPFEPKLKVKHNAKRPFQSRLLITVDSLLVDENDLSDAATSKHPYKYELDHFKPNEKDLNYAKIQDFSKVDQNPVEIIDDEEKLKKLCQLLMNSDEFAVDLEHHSYRTFQGLTCLMQISTRSRDFIVDTLKLWKSVHLLNEPFTDSRILKVFHGADRDVEWLQRDFGIYVVNMFDTSQAMRILGMARFSLAHLIKTYFDKDLNKQFQLADWRIRPLPEVLVNYAIDDTRFLLHCYDRLKNDLLDKGNERKNLLVSVFERSRDICLKHYEKPLLGERDYLRLCAASKKHLNARQLMALRELYAWRDRTARLEDESPAYVLPDHMLRQIAEVLPREMQGVLSCCNPAPPLVRRELRELHEIVLRARDAPADPASKSSPAVEALDRDSGRMRAASVDKPHDFSHAAEDEEIVPLWQRLAGVRAAAIKLKPAPTLCF